MALQFWKYENLGTDEWTFVKETDESFFECTPTAFIPHNKEGFEREGLVHATEQEYIEAWWKWWEMKNKNIIKPVAVDRAI